MTAEIAILNKSAIALAADSAVTSGSEEIPKIFNTADKLFRLSLFNPIGIMLYGQASFMGVPWETIIKEYRNRLWDKNYNYLKEYADDFINFIQNDEGLLFPESKQIESLQEIIGGLYVYLNERIEKNVKETLEKKKKIRKTEISKIASKVINEYYRFLNKQKDLTTVTKKYGNEIVIKYEKMIDVKIKEIFQKLPIYKKDIKKLKNSIGKWLSKNIFPDDCSGVVVAGFGKKDIFPKLSAFKVETLLDKRLKYEEESSHIIDHQNNASIGAFAQGEMVYTFMEGVDPNFLNIIEESIEEILTKYPDYFIEDVEGLSEDLKKRIKEKASEVGERLTKEYFTNLEEIRQLRYVQPVTSIVSILPKDELASMAETLVNLTLFKRRVTPEAETVGGPIDVAVITKGDGFIWIKRKKYFDRSLNPHYYK